MIEGGISAQAGPGEDKSIYERLGFMPMDESKYNSIRDRYGVHECAQCGELFKTPSECEEHVQSHSGKFD